MESSITAKFWNKEGLRSGINAHHLELPSGCLAHPMTPARLASAVKMCASVNPHGRWTEHTFLFLSFLPCSFLPLSPSFFSFFQDSNQQNTSSNIFHSAPGVVLNQQGKLTQWTRLLPPGPSLCLCDPGPVTFDHGAYWALLLSSDPFTPTPPPSSLLGGQKQASLQNTSNSKGQNLSPPLSHRT